MGCLARNEAAVPLSNPWVCGLLFFFLCDLVLSLLFGLVRQEGGSSCSRLLYPLFVGYIPSANPLIPQT